MVKSVADKFTMVLAGAFNPAILTPQWIARNAMGFAPDQQFQVEMIAPIAGIAAVPRYTFEHISYVANFQAITFFLGAMTDPQREALPGIVRTILDLLPHTPVAGLGFNFVFSTDANNAAIADLLVSSPDLLDAFPEGAEIVNRSWANGIKWNDALVTYSCRTQADVLLLESNFHYGVATAHEARDILAREHVYRTHYNLALDAAEKLTKEQLEN